MHIHGHRPHLPLLQLRFQIRGVVLLLPPTHVVARTQKAHVATGLGAIGGLLLLGGPLHTQPATASHSRTPPHSSAEH
jgi:hypothetical protein